MRPSDRRAIHVDFRELGALLRCVIASQPNSGYRCLLTMMPGNLLVEMCRLHGPRLLEPFHREDAALQVDGVPSEARSSEARKPLNSAVTIRARCLPWAAASIVRNSGLVESRAASTFADRSSSPWRSTADCRRQATPPCFNEDRAERTHNALDHGKRSILRQFVSEGVGVRRVELRELSGADQRHDVARAGLHNDCGCGC